ncbi:Cys-tRNA(Pro) deacylase [Hoyosella rhizosphaerae]|uniref:Cys-tRNA(Pro)/Cys-tRNA(Cys) deacylase n=1 Tax=Hoyosella rhizosphaerae TaxID=1755582 RepID=A0A916UKS4_9ACTN|nr:YbaK/EbsC family protein [Hoyosella rhizosphaerae]MBN4925422.1 Cys-tRNA(Pro) deacylase [Hoyosella rhizosphaerae]GGC75308.1 Cys-tRNA(Pro)/Cys-tRNA(Cys) deacylase [Hoyosella rhizosphaerae]
MPSPHVRVVRALEGHGVEHCFVDHADMATDIRSPRDFADALGYDLGRITKSVVLRSRSDDAVAVVVCGMDRKLNFKAVSAIVGAGRMEMADSDCLAAVVGYPRHGVSPLGLEGGIAVVVDRKLLDEATVLAGAGAVGVEVEMAPADLVSACGAVVADISA